jgi:hypothetical protein
MMKFSGLIASRTAIFLAKPSSPSVFSHKQDFAHFAAAIFFPSPPRIVRLIHSTRVRER